ncbi:MAG: hypothetical protein MK324_15335 [Pirellulales bacterium]|nr:hypothetical protein [Pirellulales bacterium]
MTEIEVYTQQDDQYYNYCWWPSQPKPSPVGKLRPVALLLRTFALADVSDPGLAQVLKLQQQFGLFRTVWGVKYDGDQFDWEYYFYDYARCERSLTASDVIAAFPLAANTRPLISVNEDIPYFMCSVNTNVADLVNAHALSEINLYIGNPGSTISSGISYVRTANDLRLGNLYNFFDAKENRDDIISKINCSAFSQLNKTTLERILHPVLADCSTICLANKKNCDTIYFSGINVSQLIIFMRIFEYTNDLIDYIENNRMNLDHLYFDVGYDYRVSSGLVSFLKSGVYGIC